MKSPNILLCTGNPRELIRQIEPLITKKSARQLEADIQRNVKLFFALGEEHFSFAKGLAKRHWRQRVSRAYYGAYHVARSIRLQNSGEFKEGPGDHKSSSNLPDGLRDSAAYGNQLKALRSDRNLADYDPHITKADLVNPPPYWIDFVERFIHDARLFLKGLGVRV